MKEQGFGNLPQVVLDFIASVIKKMRYRRKVRQEVKAELAGHFADALSDCQTDEERQAKAKQLINEFGDVKLLGKLIRWGKKRCRPLWRTMVARSFQAVGVLFILLVYYCVYISFAQPRIKINYLDEFNRLARPVADEDLNAAPLYQKAIEAYVKPPKTGKKTQGGGVEPAEGGGKEAKPKPETKEADLLDAIGDKKWITDLTDEEVALLKQWVGDNGKAIDFFKRANEKPHCWWQRETKDGVLLSVYCPELSPIKNLGKLICWRAKLRASEGEIEEAFDDLLGCYGMGSHLMGPRTLVEQLLGLAMRAMAVGNVRIVLAECEIEGQALAHFNKQLEKIVAKDIYKIDFQTEKFFYRDIIQRCFTDNGRGSGRMIPGRVKEIGDALSGFAIGDNKFERGVKYGAYLGISLISADREALTSKYEDAFSKYETWAKMTPWELKKTDIDEWERKEFGEASTLEQSRYLLYCVMMPGLRRVGEIAHRVRTEVESLITTVAVLGYNKEKSRYPESLSELVEAGLLSKLPTDPYSDKPLVYRRTDDGFTLYSVGVNFKDDSGQIVRYTEGKSKGKINKWADNGDSIFWPIN